MKKPKLSDLKLDPGTTKRIRREMVKEPTVKITINVDAESLKTLKELSTESGVPYQRLLNKLIKEGLARRSTVDSRITRLEKELARIKKKLVA